jgi:ABC-type oligopeptide transport system ATPase subunit
VAVDHWRCADFRVAPSWIKKMDRDLARAGDEHAYKYPIQLSGGQQQSAAIAWAM